MDFLAEHTPDDRAALLVLYGRRRLGKTSLLRRFAEDRRSVFFVADMSSRQDQLAAFSRVLFDGLSEPALEGTVLPSWEAALRFTGERAKSAPLLLVLDEFSYLCDSDPSLPSVIQRLWDAELCQGRLHLILCGSYVSFMERELLGSRNPLYGRRSGEWLLEPLHFRDARQFFATSTVEDQIRYYGILGGTPAYLERFDPASTLADNVVHQILARGSPLYNEPRFLLMQELRDPHTYFSICRAVAFGRTTPNEIAQGAGLSDRGVVSRYLQTLRELHLIERRTPATERNPDRTRRSHYHLADPFLRFWFRFVLPNYSALEVGDARVVYDTQVAPYLEQHVSLAFEEIAVQHLQQLQRTQQLPALYQRIGGWWRGSTEVDLVAVSEDGALLLGEVKWSARAVGTDILDSLVAKTAEVANDLPRPPSQVTYCLWSRSGFTPALRQRAEAGQILLYGLDDL
ncbi:MAG: ATP-binding protein [Bradymonadales bacterium]|nr:ATP-binding protein [Bradymonadales bacterium]